MCIHPEATHQTKNFSTGYANHYHTPTYRDTHDLPDKAYWVVRNSSYYRPELRTGTSPESC